MVPDASLIQRFRADLDRLIGREERLGIAVSGGPDSLALLLLAAVARPGLVEAATVDHGLRPASRAEAEDVAAVCQRLSVPHTILAIEWDVPPSSAIQEQARDVRYGALAAWMRERSLDALLTGHHLDDQAETLVMRLNRGAGVRGLAGMRQLGPVPGRRELKLIRPLLSWRRSELEAICGDAGLQPAADPSNEDSQFERVRIRTGLREAAWLDSQALARSASNLAAADDALEWAAASEWNRSVENRKGSITYYPSTAPAEIRRRIVARAINELATEGPYRLRGRELDRLIADLESGASTTLRGVRCAGGSEWSFKPAPRRKPKKS